MKIVTIIGTRPQTIKAASLSRRLREDHEEILVDTGQHYDKNMSEIFYKELEIPKPHYNLAVGSGSHANQTAKMMIGIEEILLKENPDMVLLYGDTNSTLAAAVTAGKLCIPIAHIEAGVRTFLKNNPEEQNRIVTDHLATWRFVPSEYGMQCLKKEGLEKNSYNVGDIMVDGLIYYGKKANEKGLDFFKNRLEPLFRKDQLKNDQWYLATSHRPENTDDNLKLEQILKGLNQLDSQVVFPVHPRIQNKVKNLIANEAYENIFFVKPLGYIEMLFFAQNAIKIITDSGGLQKEAFLMKVPGVIIFDVPGWPETFKGNCNVLAKADEKDIIQKINETKIDRECFEKLYYGDGKTAVRICNILKQEVF